MAGPAGRKSAGCLCAFGLLAAVIVTVWWGFVVLGLSDFDSDCTLYYGEFSPRTGDCYQANMSAREWLPGLSGAAWVTWIAAVIAALPPYITNKPPPRARIVSIVIGTTVALITGTAFALGLRAFAITTP